MNSTRRIVILLSGGVDSTVLLHQAFKSKAITRSLYLDFGKPTSVRELNAAKRQSLDLNVPLDVVDAKGIAATQMALAPAIDFARDELDIKDYEPEARGPGYVSGFPIVLSIGSYYTQLVEADELQVGVIFEQSRTHPKLPNAIEASANATNTFNPSLRPISISTPLSKKRKSEVVGLANSLGIRLESTWSCLHGLKAHCGACPQCESRIAAFKAANVRDPTTYGT